MKRYTTFLCGSIILIAIFLLLYYYFVTQSVIYIIPSIISFLLGAIGIILKLFDDFFGRRKALRDIEKMVITCFKSVEEMLGTKGSRTLSEVKSSLGDLSLYETVNEDLIEYIATVFVEQCVSLEKRLRLGHDLVKYLLIALMTDRLSREKKVLTKSIITTYLYNQIQFSSPQIDISPAGYAFIRGYHYIKKHGTIGDLEEFAKFIQRKDEGVEIKTLQELIDPCLSFLVFELGKGSDIRNLLMKKEVSGLNLMKGLQRQYAMIRGDRGKDSTIFLLLKQELQEKRGGQRRIHSQIKSFKNYVGGYGSISHRGKTEPFQSAYIIRSPYPYKTAKNFVNKFFPFLYKLNPREQQSANLFAIKLRMEDLCVFPEEPEKLTGKNRERYYKILNLFEPRKVSYHNLLRDFDVRFIQLITYLTFDFLIKDVLPTEKIYFRKKTKHILKKLKINNILEITKFSKDAFQSAIKDITRPKYTKYEIESLSGGVDYFDLSEENLIEERLNDISGQIIRNAQKLSQWL